MKAPIAVDGRVRFNIAEGSVWNPTARELLAMASGAANPPKNQVDSYQWQFEATIQDRLGESQRQLKWFELFVLSGKLVAGLMAITLSVVLVDHWVMTLGFVPRIVALVGILAIGIWFTATRIFPLLVLKINPVYVARIIERTAPHLKNSLVNYLTYRRGQSSMAKFAEKALQHRAASDLVKIPTDVTVNRGAVLRTVALLGFVAVLFFAYSVVSPKSTLQSLRRVVMPWGGFERPTRVKIISVSPGDKTVLFGDRPDIKVKLEGIRKNETVEVVYSTTDRQVSAKRIKMKVNDSGEFQATLPHESHRGMEVDTDYQIIAGDASSPEYHLKVKAAPAMLIEKIVYKFPTYTQRPPKTVAGRGAIRAIDGTKVTVFARANQKIGLAHFVHQPAGSGKPLQFAMSNEGETAKYEWRLDLRYGNRQTYQLQLTTTDRISSQRMAKHDIDVIPDLPPEIEIRSPNETRIEVPLNQSLAINVRAIDPDYGLSKVSLSFDGLPKHEGPFEEQLLPDSEKNVAQFSAQYVFRPGDWELEPNNEIIVHALAVDNRSLPWLPEEGRPNESSTSPLVIVITEPTKEPRPAPSNDNQDDRSPQNPDQAPNSENQTSDQSDPNKDPNSKPEDHESTTHEKPSDGGKPNDHESPTPEDGEPRDKEPMKGADEVPQDQTKENGDSTSTEKPEAGTEPNEQNGGPEEKTGSDGNGKQPEDNQGTEGANTEAQDGGANSDMGHSESSPDGQLEESGSDGSDSGQAGDEATDASHDGEVIEETLKYLQQKENGTDQATSESNSDENSTKDSATEDTPMSQGSESSQKNSSQKPQDPESGSEKTGSETGSQSTQEQSGTAESQSKNSGDSATNDSSTSESAGGDSGQNKPGDMEKSETKPQGSDEHQSGSDSASSGSDKSENSTDDMSSKPKGSDSESQDSTKPQETAEGNSADTENKTGQPTDSNMNSSQDSNSQTSDKGSNTDGTQTSEKSQGAQNPSQSKENGTKGSQSKPNQASDSNSSNPSKRPSDTNDDQTGSGSSSEQSDMANGQGNSGESSDSENSASSESATNKTNKPEQGSGDPGSDGNGGQGNKPPPGSSDIQGSDDSGSDGNGSQGSKSPPGSSDNQGSGSSSDSSGQGTKGTTGRPSDENASGSGTGSQDMASSNKPGSDSNGAGTSNSPNGSPSGRPGDGAGPNPGGGNQDPSSQNGSAQGAKNPGASLNGAEGDKANLEYTRKTTKLVLDYLKNQQDNPDEALLKRLRWTPEELREFVARWETLRALEQQGDQDAKKKLDRVYRSLGLRAVGGDRQSVNRTDDRQRGLSDASRNKPPASFAEKFRAYKRGVAQ